MQGNALWPMFAFGFGRIFVITQMHGSSLSRWGRLLIMAAYAGAAALVYSRWWTMARPVHLTLGATV